MPGQKFKFELGAEVQIAYSDEIGEIRARAQYVEANCKYYVAYKAADGRAVEQWWSEDQLVPYVK